MQLTQLFQNLVQNALTYRGKQAPLVHIEAHKESAFENGDNPEWVFSVTDNGIGIDPDATDRIFEIFQRLHTQNEYPGTGIGLSVCKRIVERHKGHIWAESEPKKGTTFHFTLPFNTMDLEI